MRFYGLLGTGLGVQPGAPVVFDLPDGATYATLLGEVGASFGELFPPGVWDASSCRFNEGIEAVARGHGSLTSESMPLCDGMQIDFLVPLAGG